jgi:hypothetical protein
VAVFKTRTRLVYFRISEDEFQEYTRLCQSEGVRSLSDLARSAVNRMIDSYGPGSEAVLTEKIQALEAITNSLNQHLSTLSDLLKRHQSPEIVPNPEPETE